MNVVWFAQAGFEERISQLTAASSLFDRTIEDRARSIVEAVQQRGDEALTELTERFDGALLTPDRLRVTKAELLNAALKADDQLRAAVSAAAKNISSFSRKSLRVNWSAKNAQGGRVGEKFDPFQRVGIYIPGGTAPLVSTALMTIVLAKVAGCTEIVVCTPCNATGRNQSGILYAANAAGATEIYRLGGAQAIAAMALARQPFVACRRFLVRATPTWLRPSACSSVMWPSTFLPGPSEVLVLADDPANARFVAADLLAQAEHGSGHERVWLITPSAKLLAAVQKEMERQLPQLSRREFIETSIAEQWLA